MAASVSCACCTSLSAASLYFGISREIGRTAQRIFDRAACQVARLDHIVGSSGVIGFSITHHVYDVRLYGHLHIDAGGQVRAGGIDLQRIDSTGRCASAARCESHRSPTAR